MLIFLQRKVDSIDAPTSVFPFLGCIDTPGETIVIIYKSSVIVKLFGKYVKILYIMIAIGLLHQSIPI